jgi:hypothetical protein
VRPWPCALLTPGIEATRAVLARFVDDRHAQRLAHVDNLAECPRWALIALEHRFLVAGLPEMSESVPASLVVAAGVPDDQV